MRRRIQQQLSMRHQCDGCEADVLKPDKKPKARSNEFSEFLVMFGAAYRACLSDQSLPSSLRKTYGAPRQRPAALLAVSGFHDVFPVEAAGSSSCYSHATSLSSFSQFLWFCQRFAFATRHLNFVKERCIRFESINFFQVENGSSHLKAPPFMCSTAARCPTPNSAQSNLPGLSQTSSNSGRLKGMLSRIHRGHDYLANKM